MGSRRRFYGRVSVFLFTAALYFVTFASLLRPIGAASHCKLQLCSLHFTRAMEAGGIAAGPTYEYCSILNNYSACVRATARSCRGHLEYHVSDTVLLQQINENNCSFVITQKPRDLGHQVRMPKPKPTMVADCAYRGHGPHVHCGLFGDPHLKTVTNEFQTCRVFGAWPLIDNPYLEVQVTNEAVIKGESATATSKITIIIRDHGPCTEGRTYSAEKDYLPAVFTDGSKSSKPDRSVRIKEEVPGRHVEIHIRHIATRIIIRQVGHYLTFAIRLPLEIANLGAHSDNLQLCVKGCPKKERIDHKQFLTSSKQWLLSSKTFVAVEEAIDICHKYNLTDFYYDACVFDLLTTGDRNFSQAAHDALEDILHLHPSALRAQKNRTPFKYEDLIELDRNTNSSTRELFKLLPVYLFICSAIVSAAAVWMHQRVILT